MALIQARHRLGNMLVLLCLSIGLIACGPQPSFRNANSETHNDASRSGERAPDTNHAERRSLARRLIAELLEPGGDAGTARELAQRLENRPKPSATGDSYWVHFAQALDSNWHGRLTESPEHYMQALSRLRKDTHPQKELLAHFAAQQAIGLRHNSQDLWSRWSTWVEQAVRDPRGIGWRTRALLVHWQTTETRQGDPDAAKQTAVRELGCIRTLTIAGPFGPGNNSAIFLSHPPETTRPWPHAWPLDQTSGRIPQQLETEADGCLVTPKEAQPSGIYYARTTLHLHQSQKLILSAGNTIKIWVNGKVALSRDPRTWGSWIRKGVALELPKGDHVVVAKYTTANATLQVSTLLGLPLNVKSTKGSLAVASPQHGTKVHDASTLGRYVNSSGVLPPSDPLVRYAAARLSAAAGEPEAAALLIEPDLRDLAVATGPTLLTAAEFARNDPAFTGTTNEDRVRDLFARALKRDSFLWEAELDAISRKAKTQGIEAAVSDLREATDKFKGVPNLLSSLASAYGELGWQPEYAAAVKLRAKRFPEELDGQHAVAQVYLDEGSVEEYRRAIARIKTLDPDSDVMAEIAIQQQNYPLALIELRKLGKQRPTDKNLKRRIENLEERLSGSNDPQAKIDEAIERHPKNAALRTLLADSLYSSGNPGAHNKVIAEAVQAGANTQSLNHAADLLSGTEELAAYRLNGLAVIEEYEAENRPMPGTAARILDYLALWVRADGSSRMLEHEIIKIKSEEAISKFAEGRITGDRVLQMRVIKRDGRILEPEIVKGKPTVTFPHLEVGDYIETEQLMGQNSARNGSQYDGPTWFFRERDVSYARSEFVFISPKGRSLNIETTGNVPAPTLEADGALEVRRWRVNRSPAAPNEPNSAPLSEYLPSVHISWGYDLERHLLTLAHGVERTTPIDPRVVRIARKIAANKERSLQPRLLYRWVLQNVRPGKEADGRRAIFSKKGNQWRAFVALCDALGIRTSWAFARSRISPTPAGPASRAAQYRSPVLLVGDAPVALTFSGKYFPYGYVPSELRGQQAYVVSLSGSKRVQIPTQGFQDALRFEGRLSVERDGSARGVLTHAYEGRLAARVREALEGMGEQRLHGSLESQVLGRVLRGSKLLDYKLIGRDQLDAPVRIRMNAEVPQWVQSFRNQLRITPPFTPTLSEFATLPVRKTPILLQQAQTWHIYLTLKLPRGSRVDLPANKNLKFRSFQIEVKDRIKGDDLVLERMVHLPAGRIGVDVYNEFVRFTRAADGVLAQEISVQLAGTSDEPSAR